MRATTSNASATRGAHAPGSAELGGDAPIPVTALTGFLGAGKTTLLSAILKESRFADTAVIVNEFGEIALDHDLIDVADETLVETTSGCLCCTVQGDVRRAIDALLDAARGPRPAFRAHRGRDDRLGGPGAGAAHFSQRRC